MIRLELWRGVRNGAERRFLELLETRVDSLEISNAVWGGAIDLMNKARASGLSVPSPDVLIVATAHYHGAQLEHCDQHMDRLLKLV
jgi:predicted nucleic acid-binding protein